MRRHQRVILQQNCGEVLVPFLENRNFRLTNRSSANPQNHWKSPLRKRKKNSTHLHTMGRRDHGLFQHPLPITFKTTYCKTYLRGL